ncbi:MAG: hypothetical protein IJE16_04005 [Ruminococcus sp.]|nr:hypothetical protein [Ruminococcus sp.]
MKNKIVKSIMSLMLILVMVISMLSVSFVSAGAVQADVATTSGVGKKVAERLLEQGVRAICELTLQLGEHIGGEGEEKVESFAKWFLMDASEAAAYDAKQLCYDILNELIVLEEKIADYTTEISTQIEKQNASKELDDYSDALTTDVTDVMKNNGVLNAFDCYYKYFLITHLNESGLPEDKSELDAINSIWHEITGSTLNITTDDISDEACDNAREALDKSFLYIRSSTGNSEEAVYKSALTNEHFAKAINELSTNFVYTGLAYDDSQLSVVESAATYAYFALPYSHQQYEFVKSVADKQVLVAMILQMTYNEFLAKQGEYLEEYYKNKPIESGSWNTQNALFNGSGRQSYEGLKTNAIELLEYTGDEAAKLYDAKLDIDTSNYLSGQNYDMTLNSYMKPDDAVVDTLSISGFSSTRDYTNELKAENAFSHIDNNSHISNSKYITSQNVEFCRVMSGGVANEVYYILSPKQFETDGVESNATAIGIVDHNISRGETDLVDLYGNIHVASCDYINLIKNISDGTNTFSCPSDSEISGKTGALASLFDTPAFAFSNYIPENYLSSYIPDKRSSDTYIMTSTYSNDFDGGAAIPQYATMKLVKAGKGVGNTKDVSTESYSFENLKFNVDGGNHSYILVIENNSDEYLQKASIEAVDNGYSVEDIELVNNGNPLKDYQILSSESSSVSVSSSGTIKPGNRVTVKFKLVDDDTFVSLKCVKNNTNQTQTVLIEGAEELESISKNLEGYYEFDCYMPYSESTFVIETENHEVPLEVDENGNYLIKTYKDLTLMAEKVNSADSDYVSASYILANDITCPIGSKWVNPIGENDDVYSTSASTFRGVFDGQGYTISNLHITNGETVHNRYGLFGQISNATIKNLNLENVSMDSSGNYAGAIVGSIADGSLVSNCTVSGYIDSDCKYHIGGISGYSYDSIIEKCINYCDVTSSADYIAGICGTNRGTVNNCANFGSIVAEDASRCGGIVGGDVSGNIVTNCFNAGNVSGKASMGMGSVSGYESSDCKNNYYLDTTGTDAKAVAKTAEQFASGEVAYLLNNGEFLGLQAWYQNLDNIKFENDAYPTLVNNGWNTVYKVDREDRVYSNQYFDYLLGDVNNDGSVTVIDATLIQMHLVKLYTITGPQLLAADTDKDHTISISDATRIQFFVAKHVSEF